MSGPYQPPAAPLGQPDREPLLPRWVKLFSWIFLVIGPLGVVGSIVLAAVSPAPIAFSFLGIETWGGPEISQRCW